MGGSPLGQWPHGLSSMMASLACTLGIFNISRFAVLSVQFGANFIVQFLVMSLIIGIPLFTFHVSLGQLLGSGAMDMWRISPIFQGIGIALILSQALLGIYSIVGVSWMYVYFRDSFITKQDTYRWSEPYDIILGQNWKANTTIKLEETVSNYFSAVVLQRSNLETPANAPGHLKFQVTFNLAVVWMIVFISLSKGLKSYGKVVFLFSLAPTFGMLVLCTKLLGLAPQGSKIQLGFPQSEWGEFFSNTKSWSAAMCEAFYTWGLLGAAAMQMASHNRAKHHLHRDTSFVTVITLVVLVLAAFLANTCSQLLHYHGYTYIPSSFEKMSSYGFLHHVKGPPLLASMASTPPRFYQRSLFQVGERVIRPAVNTRQQSGYQALRLATELVPATLAVLGPGKLSPFWSVLFYFVLILFGIAQQLAIMHCVITGIMAIKVKTMKSWETTITFFTCVCGFILGLPMATELGIFVVYFLDYTVGGGWWIMLLYLIELIAVFMVRGRPYSGETVVATLFAHAGRFLQEWAAPILSFVWNVVLPVMLMVLCISVFKNGNYREMLRLGGVLNYDYWPAWSRQVGALIQLIPLLAVPFIGIVQSCRYLSNGPPDVFDRIQLLYRPSEEAMSPSNSDTVDPANADPETGNANTTPQNNTVEDPPPKYTPPPSYSTATGARIAKLMRQSFRRSVRRIQSAFAGGGGGGGGSGGDSGSGVGEGSSSEPPPPDYDTVLVEIHQSLSSDAGPTTSTLATVSEVASRLRSSFRRAMSSQSQQCLVPSASPEEKKISEVAVCHLSSVVNNFAVACDTSSIPLPPSIGDSILTRKVAQEVPEVKKPQVSEVFEKHAGNVGKPPKKLFLQGLDKPKMSIKIGNLKNSQVLEAAEEAKIKADKYEEGEITDETSEESTKLLMKIEMETTSENGSIDGKKQKLHSEQKKCRKRTKSSDSSNMNSSMSTGDVKSDEHKCTTTSEGSNGLQISEEIFSVSETSEKVNKKSNDNESSDKNTKFDNKNQLKLKKLRQLRERKLDNSSSEDEYTTAAKSPSTKSTKEDSKKAVNKSKKRSNKLKSTTDSDRSSSSSESSGSLERNRSSKSKEETNTLKDVKTSSKVTINSVSRRNFSPKTKYRKSKSRDRSASADKHPTSKAKKTRSSSRSKLRKSRSVSKSRIRNSRSQSRYFNQKSRSTSRSRQRKSLSRSRERKSRSVSYSRSRVRRSRSRSRVRRSRTPKKYYGRKSRSASKQKKSLSPPRVKTKKSRSPSRAKTRRSSSPSVSRGRRSRSLSKSMKRKSRSRGRKSSRSPSKLFSSKLVARRSSSRSNVRSLSRNRSASKSRHSRSENRSSRSKNKRSSKRRSRSRDSQSRSKQSGVKNIKGNKERSARSSSSKHSYSKLSGSGSDKSESDSKCKGSKKKKSKEKKSNSKKHKSKHKDINSRLLALSSTKVESSSDGSSSDSENGDSDNSRKKSTKVKNLSKDKSTHISDDKNIKTSKSKKDLKGKKAKDKIDSIDSTKSKTLKEVDLAEDSDNLKPKINLKQKIHYSLIDDEPVAMTESEMKILNAKNKILSKTVNPISICSADYLTKNITEKEVKNKDFSSSKRLKSKQEGKTSDLDVLKNTTVKPKLEDQLRKLRSDEIKKVRTECSPKKIKIDDVMHKGKSEDFFENAKDKVSLGKYKNEDIDITEDSFKKLNVEDAVKNKTDEIPAEVTSIKLKTEEKNKLEVLENKASISNKGSIIMKTKNSQKDDIKDSNSEIELISTANSYDSDGQRSDTAMRNMFFGNQSSSNSPDPENESSSKRGGCPHSKNDSNSSEESESESENEKTFFGISKDHIESTYEVSSKTESLVKVGNHSSDSNGSSIDKNFTDSDEDLTFGKKQIIAVKHISDSTENTTSINKKDLLFEKSSCPLNDHLKVENCNIQSVECDDNSVSSIKVPFDSIELTKESSLSLITLSNPTSVKGLSTCSKESTDKKNDVLSDLSPRRTNSQDFLYDYGKSEIEDDKLDFDEDKSSESDVTVPSKIKEDVEILNQKEKPDLAIFVTKVNTEVDVYEVNIKNIQEDINSSAVLEKLSLRDENITTKKDVFSIDVANLANVKLNNEKIVSEEKIVESTCDQTSSSNTQVSVPNSSNEVIHNSLDIPVPSVDKVNDLRIPFPCDDYKKELSELTTLDNKVIMRSESKSSDKVDGIAVSNENNFHTSHFVKEKESVMFRAHDSIDDTKVSPMSVEDKKQKVTTSIVKSISRSRSRSKINKQSSKVERSKSRSRRETSSSKRSKSKDRSTSRRSKSKEKSSNSRKGRSKSRDKRSRSKGRHSRSKERRRRSKERRSLSGSIRSRSKDKSSRLKDRRRSRSRRRALSRSRRRTRSRDRSSRSRRRNRSRSRDKRSRSRDRRKRSRSHDKRSRSRGRRAHSHSRERRSRSRRHRGRSQSSGDKRSRSHTRKERSRTNSKDRSESKDKKSKKECVHHGALKVKLFSRSKSSEKKSEIRSNSSDKKVRLSSKQERSKSKSRSCSKEKEEEKNNGTTAIEELEASDKTILNVKSPIQSSSNVILADKIAFSRSKSVENRSSSDKEMDTKTSSSEKSPDRSSKEKSISPLSFSNNSVPDPKKHRSRSNSISKFMIDSNKGNKKSKSPDSKLKRSRTKSPDIKPKRSRTKSPNTKPKRSRTKSPDSKARRSRSKSRDKQKAKEKRAKSKDRSRSKEVKNKAKARKSRSRERKCKTDEKSSKSQRKRSRTRSKSKEKNKSRDKRSRSRERRSKSRDKKSRRSRSRSRRRKSDKKDRSRRTRSRSKSRSRKRSKKSRSRSRSKDEFFIDKSKLLEIARKNALSMMKQGAVGTDLNKVTAITAGGKTVDELTDFCKLLSQKDATGQESVSSESSSENESEKPFHHPFQLKERSNNIIMNIRNCASLPVKTLLEKTTENAQQLRLQFPVSSGQLHRKSENEWIPVSPKKTDELKAIMPAPLRKQEDELPVYPGLQETAHFSNIPLPNSIPHPQPHLPTLPQIGNPWPKPHDSGLFTGTTGARFLSQAELASGQQAWAKKDQLISAQPVSGGMGMSLLQKMGWKPGEGLGKRNEGTLEPLKLQVKMDKRGLVCADEIPQPRFRPHHIPKNQPSKSLEGKHPVSLLVEYCTRKHLNPPIFTVLSEDGPAHKKNFVFKVTVNGVDYQPPNPSPNKKQAKSEAAVLCLRALGLLPTT